MSEAEKAPSSGVKSNKRDQQKPLFEFSFNQAVKLRRETSNVSANTGALLLREVDDKLLLALDIAARLRDDRDPRYVRYPVPELLRSVIYAMALGYARQDDADTLAHDPAFKTAVWGKAGTRVADERLASQPTISRLVSLLTKWDNLESFRHSLYLPILRHQQADGGDTRVRLGVVDLDGYPIPVFGDQPGAVYNGYYGKKVYSPLAAYFSVDGDFDSRRQGEGLLYAKLRPGNASPAGEAEAVIDAVILKAKELAQTVALRLDAGFAGADILNRIDQAGVRFTVRLPDNPVLQRLAQPYLVRPQGRPPKEGYEYAIELTGYRNPKWNKSFRVILVVVDKPKDGQLSLAPEYFFLCTNWPKESRSPEECLDHYRQRAVFEDRLGEWNNMRVKLSLDDFSKNEAILLLSLMAFNLMGIIRREAESAHDPRANPPHTPEGSGWDMGRTRNVLLKAGSVLVRSGRRLLFDLVEGLAPLWLAVLGRITRWHSLPHEPFRARSPILPDFMPLPAHAFRSYTPRL